MTSLLIKANLSLWKMQGGREERKSPRGRISSLEVFGVFFCATCNRLKTQDLSPQAGGIFVFFLLQGGAAPQGTLPLWSLQELSPDPSRNHRHQICKVEMRSKEKKKPKTTQIIAPSERDGLIFELQQ